MVRRIQTYWFSIFSIKINHGFKLLHYSINHKSTGDAVNYCGLKYLKYDHYIDIDNIDEGLESLIKKRPDFEHAITKVLKNSCCRCIICVCFIYFFKCFKCFYV